jgi:hypothetical protein
MPSLGNRVSARVRLLWWDFNGGEKVEGDITLAGCAPCCFACVALCSGPTNQPCQRPCHPHRPTGTATWCEAGVVHCRPGHGNDTASLKCHVNALCGCSVWPHLTHHRLKCRTLQCPHMHALYHCLKPMPAVHGCWLMCAPSTGVPSCQPWCEPPPLPGPPLGCLLPGTRPVWGLYAHIAWWVTCGPASSSPPLGAMDKRLHDIVRLQEWLWGWRLGCWGHRLRMRQGLVWDL